MKILITGASGLIGTTLTDYLVQSGHEVAHLGREKTPFPKVQQFVWDPEKEMMDAAAIHWPDAVVHLAGANVSEGRWTPARKKEIIDSRVKSAALLAKTIRKENAGPKIFVSASGTGWYGMVTEEKIFSEKDPPAADFIGECCKQWEASADLLEEIGLRTVKLRIGVVLAKEGGALAKLSVPVKWGIGSPLGSGKQWMPWIHISDLCALFLKAIEDKDMQGAYNAVASQHVSNKEFVKTLGAVLHRPVFMPAVPAFVLKMLLGEMAGVVLEGSRVSNAKLLQTGFTFEHKELSFALESLLREA